MSSLEAGSGMPHGTDTKRENREVLGSGHSGVQM